MATSVLQLRPRLRPFHVAVEAYRAGRPAECLRIVSEHTGIEADFLRARAALRLGSVGASLASLLAIDDAQLCSNRQRAELLILRGALQTRDRQFEGARETLDLAKTLALGAASAALEAEYEFYESVWSFGLDDMEGAEHAAGRALEVEPFAHDVGGYFVPLAYSRARSLQMLGLVAARRERYRQQLDFVRAALKEIDGGEIQDLWIYASLLMSLAFHVRDFDLADDAVLLREKVENRDQWPAELDRMSFEIRCALGWASALRGDHVGAFREFRAMSEFATTTPLKVLASVDRAYLARELGERHSAREEIEHAARLSDYIDWNDVEEERIGLALLAQELAAYDPARAVHLFERYRDLKTHLGPNALGNRDRRARAFEFHAEASVLRANGATAPAIQRFVKAFEIWDELGYRWRAATAALPLAELLGRQKFVDYVRREAALRPNSWLARRASELKDEAGSGTVIQLADVRMLRR